MDGSAHSSAGSGVIERVATPRCPRCGYDVSGPIDTWTVCCPLEGRCTECGHDFEWRLLLNPELSHLPRFVESRDRFRFRDAMVTAWRALRPWSFWRWVSLEQPIKIRHVLLTLLVALPTMHAAIALGGVVYAFGLALLVRLDQTTDPSSIPDALLYGLWPLADTGLVGNMVFFLSFSASIAITLSVSPVLYLVLTSTLRGAGVRRMHLLRVYLYSLFGYPWILSILYISAILIMISMDATIAILGPQRTPTFVDAMTTVGNSLFSWGLPVVLLLWVGTTWWCAGTRYLRVHHARSTSVVFVLITALFSITLLVVLRLLFS